MDQSLRIGLSQKLTQQLKMTPEMQLAIKILQLNSLELKNQITEIIETNPVVEIDENIPVPNEVPLEKMGEPPGVAGPPSQEFQEPGREDFGIDWQKYLQDSENSEFRISSGGYNRDEEETSFENFTSKPLNLHDHLQKQLHETNLNPTEMKIGEYLIGLIDRSGYLRHTPEQISELLKVDAEIVIRVLAAVKGMDPTGIAAYDLRECLLLQAREEGYNHDAVIAVIENHLDSVATNKLQVIARETGFEIEEILAAVEVIKEFNPRPGASFPSPSEEIYVTPDVFVEKVDEEYVVTLNEKDVPRLRISSMYRDALRQKEGSDKATLDFIKEKLDAARSFIRYVDKRKDTIMNVTKAICEVQKDFFDHGILHLRPLTLQDVATMAGVHESTVSRATSGKYAQTPRGLFELKFFFSGGARTSSGEDISTQVVKKRLEELVKKEDSSDPLSDGEIVDKLKAEGIQIARRTVAKYRTELNIPSSSARKKFTSE
jgi:RNA polymerase sigma-54 factor